MKFRKKPVVIDAVRFNGQNGDRIKAFAGRSVAVMSDYVVISTREGRMRGDVGDWIIRGVAGEFYPCKPEIFDRTYEPLGDGLSDVQIAYVRLYRERPDEVYRMEEATQDYDALLAFAQEVLADWPRSETLGLLAIEALGAKHGLLAPVEQAQPCDSRICWCASVTRPSDWPVRCFRPTARLKGPTA